MKKVPKFQKMKAKLQKIKFVIHPLFLLYGAVCFGFGIGKIFLTFSVCIICHELVHMIVAKRLGYACSRIKLMPYGAVLEAESDEFNPRDEVMIALSGPLFNLICALIFVALFWVAPTTYGFTADLVVANLGCGMFNLLPIFPLDGGRVILAVLSINHSRKTSVKFVKLVTIIFAIFLFVTFLISLAISPNLSIGIMSFTLFVGAFSEDKNAAYKRIIATDIKRRKMQHGLRAIITCVDENMPIGKVYRVLSFNHLNILNICRGLKIIKQIDEFEFEKIIKNYPINISIGEAIFDKNNLNYSLSLIKNIEKK